MAAPDARRAAIPAARDIRARRPALNGDMLRSRVRRAFSALTLLLLDAGGVSLALFAALATAQLVRGSPIYPGLIWDLEREVMPFIAVIVALVFASNGLYRAREVRPTGAKIIQSMFIATLIVALFAIGIGRTFQTYTIFLVAFVYAAATVTVLRASYDSITLTLMRLRGLRRRTLLAGPAASLGELHTALRASAGRAPDMEVIGVATPDGAEAGVAGARTLGTLADLPDLVTELAPHDLVLGGVELSEERLLDLVDRCREQRTRLRIVPTTMQLLLERATFVPGQAVPLLEVRPPVLIGVDWAVKRAFDLVVSVLLLVVLSPILAAIALAVRLTSPGPVIFRDRRVGIGEGSFDMLKFRSMYRDAAERQVELERMNEADGAIFKIRDDPRVTRVGRFLRRFSLDELPQLVNVLRGEMSLVGPRPLPLRDHELLEPWQRRRTLVLPGITGLWQTSGRSNLSFDDLVRLDFYYFENWSIWLDVAILLRTPFAVVSGRGAW